MNRLVRIFLKNLAVFPGAYRKLCHYAKHTDRYPEQEKWEHIAYMMQRAIAGGNVELTVTGTQHLEGHNGFMLYGNHQGLFDVVAIAATCKPPLGCAYKIELKNTPILKQIYACTKSFAMDRQDDRQSLQVIRVITEEVKQGRNYLIFPEGTRSRKGNEMLPFHAGSFRCAIKAKCPVVPFALVNSYRVLDGKGSAPVKVQLQYLEPIYPQEFAGMKAAQLAQLVKDRIQTAMAQSS